MNADLLVCRGLLAMLTYYQMLYATWHYYGFISDDLYAAVLSGIAARRAVINAEIDNITNSRSN